MTCKGYDAKAVKVPKSVKRAAGAYKDKHQRGAFIRSFVEVIKDDARKGSRKE